MSINNTSLLDMNTYEKHEKLVLEFLHDMYLMTGTNQTSHLSIVHQKIQKVWDKYKEQDPARSNNLYAQVAEVYRENTGKSLGREQSVINLVRWAFAVRKWMTKATEFIDDKSDHCGVDVEPDTYWEKTGEFLEEADEYDY